MKKIILTGLILISVQLLYAQINAITETGDEVVLYQDGTWKIRNDSIFKQSEINVNDKEFLKDINSKFLVKSNKLNIGLWLNTNKWSFSKGNENDFSEYKFQKKGGDLYGLLISEKMEIPIETLQRGAIENAKKAVPDIKVIKEEFRIVNGVKVLMMQMSGTVQGVKFMYYGYYYSNTNGSIQLLAFTSEKLFVQFKNEIELFLNGLVVL